MKALRAAFSAGLCALGSALAADPPTAPILRIEAGMHTAMIWRVSVDQTGRLVLTVSDDKTARLWELPSGRLLRVLRPPQSQGNEGKLFAGALSPDGRLAAVGGLTGQDLEGKSFVYLFDTATGRMVRRLPESPMPIYDLAFSASGRWLAAGLYGGGGLQIWEAATGREVGRDPEYGGGGILGLGWHGDGQLVATGADGRLRLYAWPQEPPARLVPNHSASVPQGRLPMAARFSPDGKRIAVGFIDTTSVAVVSASDLSLLFAPKTADVKNGNLGSVEWSADGATLSAAGQWDLPDGDNAIRRWSDAGKGRALTVSASTSTVMDLRPLPGGATLFGTGDPSWGVLSKAGAVSTLGRPPIADYRALYDGFRVSAEASTIGFAYQGGGKIPARFDVQRRELKLVTGSKSTAAGLRAPRTTGLEVRDWQNHPAPKFKGQSLALDPYETARSLAIFPDASAFVLGTEYWLRCYSATGVQRWQIAIPGVVWSVNVSANGRLAMAAYADGTIRWHRTDSGLELLAFFPHADRKRWVAWMPQGYYDCSPGAEDLIGWHVNRGKDQAADFFPAAKFRDQFYRPDLIQNVLVTGDFVAANRAASEAAGRATPPVVPVEDLVKKMQPPVVEIVGGGLRGEVSIPAGVEHFTVHYRVRRGGAEPVTRVRLLVDGRPVQAEAPIPASDTTEAKATSALPSKDCVLTVLAENRFAVSEPATLRLLRAGEPPGPVTTPESTPEALKPKLYLLAAGISDYLNNDQLQDLQFAAKDASDFAAAFRRQEGGLYQKVEVKLLADKEATANNIVDGLDWIKQQTTAKDLAVIFLSGHGENDEELRYFFCAYDYDKRRRLRTGVSIADIQGTLRSIPGKVLFFIDSCHAGNALGKLFAAKSASAQVDLTRLVNELSGAENGAIVFTSSTGRQLSLELAQERNGAFTKAIIEGLDGKADLRSNGRITVSSLEFFLAERVKELTDGQQTPTVAKPQTVPDFPIAVKR